MQWARVTATAFLLLLEISALAQANCPLPPAIQSLTAPRNIFSDRQEIDLGDAMAESLAQNIRIIEDDDLTAYLRALGARIVQHLPPSDMKFRFYLIELPEVNAFGIAGGRVYISRKLVALTQSDDELAGVIAHELGHIVTHQFSIVVTRRLKEVLGVTQVTDRADIFDKYHRLMENAGRKPLRATGDDEKNQYSADQVALYAMARAGYAPHAFIDWWDRFQQTQGKIGSWFSDLFNETTPAEHRLREMVKDVSALPAGCADIPPGARTAEFASWQHEVIKYSDVGLKESVPGLLLKQTLALPLRPDISNLHFSPDGKYILAQDEGGIHVLTREPFLVSFFIPAIDVLEAKFSPDSRSVVFHTGALRVESWSMADQKRSWVHELTALHPCLQSELSPDGSLLACLDDELRLSLIEVASGITVASKKSFVELDLFGRMVLFLGSATGTAHLLDMHFSPDGRYFLAGTLSAHFGWDVANRREMSLPESVKHATKESFAFLGPDRIVGIDTSTPAKSPILRFPSGDQIAQVRLGSGVRLRPVARGGYVFVGPLKKEPLGLLNLKTGALPLEFKREAADVFDDVLVSERVTGELALHTVGQLEPLAKLKLPQARLGQLQAAAVSPDLNWMAISNRTRGAAWDVTHNIRTIEMPSFHGAWADSANIFFVDMARFGEMERQIIKLNVAAGTGVVAHKVGDVIGTQHGPYFVKTVGKGNSESGAFMNADLEVQEVRNSQMIWKRHFDHDLPEVSFGSGTVLLTWPLTTAGGRSELQHFPDLKGRGEGTDYISVLRDLKTDAVLSTIRINTNKGSFHLQYAFVVGNWFVASATGNQILTYALSTREQKGHFFGVYPVASATGLLALDSQAGHVKVYDLASSQLRHEYVFPERVAVKSFSSDGERLLVLTANQTIYIVDATAQ
ncbi:MAG TPA: M48 family metalloprotease [Terriglobales bacterium]|nr:M48 family metalloprotease [Terriglobales bacterium]